VRRALELCPGSLETEIHWLYYTQGLLQKVLNDSRALVDKSRKNPNPSKEELEMDGKVDIAVPRLTAGGIITLERTLGKLQGLLDGNLMKNTLAA
jgi:ubiquitin-conjugating enzyme E2 O